MKPTAPEYFADMEEAMRGLTINKVFAYPFSFATAMLETTAGIVKSLERFWLMDEYAAAVAVYSRFDECGVGGPNMLTAVKGFVLQAARDDTNFSETVGTRVVQAAYRSRLITDWRPPDGIDEFEPEKFAGEMFKRSLIRQEEELFTTRLVLPLLTTGMMLGYAGREPAVNMPIYAVRQVMDYVRDLPLDERWVRAVFTSIMRQSFTEVFFHAGKYSIYGEADKEFQEIMQEKGLF